MADNGHHGYSGNGNFPGKVHQSSWVFYITCAVCFLVGGIILGVGAWTKGAFGLDNMNAVAAGGCLAIAALCVVGHFMSAKK